jgi:hypothetical protein
LRAENLSLYGVEIAGLKTVEAAHQVWKASLANRWISFIDSFSGKKKNQQNPSRVDVR